MNVINQQRPSAENFTQFRNGPSILPGAGGATVTGHGNIAAGSSLAPPPVPPRIPQQVQNYQPYGMGYNSAPSGYGFGNGWNYRGLGGGGSYGSYGTYNGYSQMYPTGFQNSSYPSQLGAPSGDVENRFIQFAENNSRPAFQSVESIVRTFSSVAMMLESTLFAMTNSFRAVLSVAENFGRTRNMFGELMSAFAFVRFFKWLYRKITFMLGLNPDDPSTERVWRRTAAEAMNSDETGATTWPILVFLSLALAIPYIVNKLMNNARRTTASVVDDSREWYRCNEPIYSALVLYDFEPVRREELMIKSGQKVVLAPQSLQPKNLPGWTRASDGRGGVGLVPINHTRIVGQIEKKFYDSNDAQTSSSLPPNMLHSVDSSLTPGELSKNSKESVRRLLDDDIVQ